MKITCISDTHCHHKKIKMPSTDMIIHAGDFTYHGDMDEVQKFLQWYGEQQAKYKLLICGNHEVWISQQGDLLKQLCQNEGIQLLHNSHTVIEGLTIFGSPYSKKFGRWAYMADDHDLKQIWDKAPIDTDIFVVHGPPYGILDKCSGGNVGSMTLEDKLKELYNLKLCIFGHIHEQGGTILLKNEVVHINAAICGIPYTDIKYNPITIEIERNDDYIVYGLKDPITKEIRYVGKSCSGLKRPNAHVYNSELKKKCKKSSWIKSLLRKGFIPEIVILDKLRTQTQLDEREIFWISQYGNLTNMTKGGTGGDTGGGAGRRKPIVCKNINTGEEKAYKSIQDAKIDGFSPSTVVAICKHKKKTLRGFTFKYKDGVYPDYNIMKSCSGSGYRGVVLSENCKTWEAYIFNNKVRENIGRFNSAKEAAEAYNKRAIELKGNKARLNKI